MGFLEPHEAVPPADGADPAIDSRRCAYRYPKGLCRAPRDPGRRWCERHAAEYAAAAQALGGAEVRAYARPES